VGDAWVVGALARFGQSANTNTQPQLLSSRSEIARPHARESVEEVHHHQVKRPKSAHARRTGPYESPTRRFDSSDIRVRLNSGPPRFDRSPTARSGRFDHVPLILYMGRSMLKVSNRGLIKTRFRGVVQNCVVAGSGHVIVGKQRGHCGWVTGVDSRGWRGAEVEGVACKGGRP
jgi:hypothetical protein